MGEAAIPMMLGAAGSTVLGKMMSPSVPAIAQPPEPLPTPVMPTPDDRAVRAAAERRIALAANTGGRASTYLSEFSDSGSRLG